MSNSENNAKLKLNSNRIIVFSTVLILSIVALLSCGGQTRFVPAPELPGDKNHVPRRPQSKKINVIFDSIDKVTAQQLKESLDISRQLRHLSYSPKEAFNINAFGEVPNSSWFTNRNAARRMSIEEIVKGPDRGSGPDTTMPWKIIRAKSEGVTPGFTIEDAHGDIYLIKFDPKGYPELATGAEVISTKLFYAAGYNTPENYLTYFHAERLIIGEKVKYIDPRGKEHYMTPEDLSELLERVDSLPDGRIRALASKYVPGKPIGPFRYESTRKDDPNDFIPHQHRRELRGLYVMAAWLKHTDTKDGNSLDSYVTENGVSFVRHYLIDFGSTLGSAATGPFKPEAGHVHHADLKTIFWNSITLGLHVKNWEKNNDYKFNSIGRYRSDTFNPGKFKSNIPNPAFDLMTDLDGYWGAKLVMSFTDSQLAAVVKLARYSDPEAEAHLLRILKERRDKIGKYWFSKVNPLDRFELRIDGTEGQELYFEDLAISTGLESGNRSSYLYEIKLNGNAIVDGRIWGEPAAIEIPADAILNNRDQMEIIIRVLRNGRSGKWVKIYLDYKKTTGLFELVGIKRQS
ncbi:MAG: hypothetical protein JSU85_03490 [Candidatus Zixiibacteriota bacterium]|nr:MAG: hypothetical protein JSU85_03490 [candidate division Zixibacteria bacterium]